MSEIVRAAFIAQADWCRRLDAPFTAEVCDTLAAVLDRSTAVGRRVLDWPGDAVADALALRLTGGLNALVRDGSLPGLVPCYPPDFADGLAPALAAALDDVRLLPWLESAPQTNEVARSAVLMAGLLAAAAVPGLPLALFELGASAGLNLRLDRYAYRLGGVTIGAADAPLTLTPDWDGADPPVAPVRVVSRRGVDLAPIDLTDAAARARLFAYVWPEQTARLARLDAAVAAFVADPVPIERGDAAAWVEANVAPAAGIATVVLHSIAFHYFPPAAKARINAHLMAQGARTTVDAPLAWLRFEFDDAAMTSGPALRLTLWPGGEERLLARAGPHGAHVQWFG